MTRDANISDLLNRDIYLARLKFYLQTITTKDANISDLLNGDIYLVSLLEVYIILPPLRLL